MTTSGSRPIKRRHLSIDKILDASIEVLRTEGADALSMRRIAEACGVTPMAVYHHVPDKEALEILAADRILLEAVADTPGAGGDWRDELVNLMTAVRERLLETPGAGAIVARRTITGPGSTAIDEAMDRHLLKGGLSVETAAEAKHVLSVLTIGSVAYALSREERGGASNRQSAKATFPIDPGGDPGRAFANAIGAVLDAFDVRLLRSRRVPAQTTRPTKASTRPAPEQPAPEKRTTELPRQLL